MSLTIDTAALETTIRQCGNPNALAEAASGLQGAGSSIGSTGDQLVSRWRGLSGCYFAPEAGQLVAAIQPVQTKADSVGNSIAPVGSAMSALAGELTTLKPRLQELLEEAVKFNAYAASHPDWTSDGPAQTQGGKAGGEFPNQPNGVGTQPNHDNVAIHQWHDRLVKEIEETTGKVVEAEAKCVQTLTTYTDTAAIGDPGGSDPKPAALPWDVQLLQGKHPFGDYWIDKGPWFARAGVGVEKSIMDGLSGLTSLVGAGFSFDPVTGDVHGNFGWHTIKAAWAGMGKLALATSVVGVAGAGGLAVAGHPGLLKSITKTYKGIWGGFTGQGLPGGWAVRSGYIFGNVAQAAVPGPGKAGLASLAEREGLVGAMARAAEAGGKGHWMGGDARLLSRMTGLADRLHGRIPTLTDRLHGLAPIRALNHFKQQHFGGEADIEHARAESARKAAKDLPELHAEQDRLRAGTLEGGRHLVDQASSPREALDKLKAHVEHGLPRDRELRDRIAAAEDKLGVTVDHHGTESRVPIHGPAAGGKSKTDLPGAKGVRAFERAHHDGGPLIEYDPRHAKEPGLIERGIRHSEKAMDRLHDFFNPGKDFFNLDEDRVGTREVSDGHGVRQEVFYTHKVGDREVETVFGVLHGKEVVPLKTPQTYFANTKELADGIPLPKELKELYTSQWHKSAWEAVPFHNVRDDTAQYNDHEEREKELRDEERKVEKIREELDGLPHEAP